MSLKRTLNLTKKVIVSSEVLKQDMIDNYGIKLENIVIIPPPVECHSLMAKQKNDVFTNIFIRFCLYLFIFVCIFVKSSKTK